MLEGLFLGVQDEAGDLALGSSAGVYYVCVILVAQDVGKNFV